MFPLKNGKRPTTLPSAVLFDTDNTLYEYAPVHEKALEATRQKAVKLLGVSRQQFDNAYAQARKEVKKRLNSTASSHSRLLYFQRTVELIGLKTQLLITLDLEQTYWRTFLASCELFPGLIEFLGDLKTLNIPTAVVTDLTAQIQFRKLTYFHLDRYFDYVVTSEEAGIEKPHPNTFRLATEKLNVGSEGIWMIGDDLITDIEGAKEALNAVTLQRVQNRRINHNNLADVAFEDYNELRKLLKKCCQDEHLEKLNVRNHRTYL